MRRPGVERFFEAGDDDAEFPWRGRGEGREEEGESQGDHRERRLVMLGLKLG